MSKKIYIDQNSFTRTKKKLKVSLEEQGISLSLSQVATVLAQSFGFKNEHEMQKLYFNEIIKDDVNTSLESSNLKRSEEEIKTLELIEKNKKGYLIEHTSYEDYDFIELTYRSINKPFEEYYKMVDDLLNNNYIDINKKGNFIIAGATGSGKTTLLRKIKEKNKRLISLESIKESNYSEEEVRDITDIEVINENSDFNIIFSFHATSCFNAIQRLKLIGESSADKLLKNTKYIIHIKRLR